MIVHPGRGSSDYAVPGPLTNLDGISPLRSSLSARLPEEICLPVHELVIQPTESGIPDGSVLDAKDWDGFLVHGTVLPNKASEPHRFRLEALMRANSRSGAALPLLAPLFWSVVRALVPGCRMRKVVGKRSSTARGRCPRPNGNSDQPHLNHLRSAPPRCAWAISDS